MTQPPRPTEPVSGRRLAHDVFEHVGRSPLQSFFSPSAVAVIGATETPGSVGRTVLANLIASPFGGTVFPVNPKRPSVCGIKAYPSIADVPAKVDLAVIVTPAATVPAVVGQCADVGVPAAIVISAGFSELGARGKALEREVLAAARRGRMRIVGPNCLGVMSPVTGLNATFAAGMALPGSVALLSQSGALLTAILDWSLQERVGLSACVSVGAMVDVGWGDLIDHFGNDHHTRAILLYIESIGDARAFVSAAREVSLSKPIILIKAGRTELAAKAAASHTGALAGADDVLEAAFRRSGVLRVDSIADLFSMAEVLGKQPRPRGPRLTIVTNAGGPGVLATDAVVRGGGELAPLSEETKRALDAVLPEAWSHANPIDVLGDATPERYDKTLELVAGDPNSDGILVVLTPQGMTDPTLTAERLRVHAQGSGKPVLASWMGGPSVRAGVDILNRAGIPTFSYPDSAAAVFCAMWRYSRNLELLYETPTAAIDAPGATVDRPRAATLVAEARAEGRTLLDERASKELLAAYGIPTVETRVAADEAAAVAAARALGFPVAVKLHSKTLTHKTDVGGVRLGITDEGGVAAAFRGIRDEVAKRAGAEHFLGVTVQPMVRMADAYELIVGSKIDPQFGPVIVFGAGGQLVEVMRDRSVALPPLNSTLARRLVERTRIAEALAGVRGRAPVDWRALDAILVRFSQLVLDQRFVKELDINPLVAGPAGIVALDARVVLHAPELPEQAIPRPAIRPYPVEYVGELTVKDGTRLRVRPIRPEDEDGVRAFHTRLSESTVRNRYMQPMPLDRRTQHERLVRVCFSDYDRDLALVVEGAGNSSDAASGILAIGRLSRTYLAEEAEFSVLVRDDWQGRGLGHAVLARLIDIGRREGLVRIKGEILPENLRMQRICSKLGFSVTRDMGSPIATAEISL